MENSSTDRPASATLIQSLRFGLWLSWRELTGRRPVFFMNIVLIAFLVSLAVTVDFMGAARKGSVKNRIDYMGPSLSIVPEGMISADLVAFRLGEKTFPQETLLFVRRDMTGLLRGSEARLILDLPAGDRMLPAVGIDFSDAYSRRFSRYALGDGEVLLGSLLADQMKKGTGDPFSILSRVFTVAGVLETAGGMEDLSVYLPLGVLQLMTGKEGRINEIRLFPASAGAHDELKGRLAEYYTNVGVVDSFRGDVAEREIDSSLRRYQVIVYAAAAFLIAITVMISTYINLDGRKPEISTIYTVGAPRGVVFTILSLRTAWIALSGAVAGQLAALVITLTQVADGRVGEVWSWNSFVLVSTGVVVLGLVVAAPFAFYSVYRRSLTADL